MSDYKKELSKIKDFKRSKSEPEIPKYSKKPKNKKYKLIARPRKEYLEKELKRGGRDNEWWISFLTEDRFLGNYRKREDAEKALEAHKRGHFICNEENFEFIIEEK